MRLNQKIGIALILAGSPFAVWLMAVAYRYVLTSKSVYEASDRSLLAFIFTALFCGVGLMVANGHKF